MQMVGLTGHLAKVTMSQGRGTVFSKVSGIRLFSLGKYDAMYTTFYLYVIRDYI